MNGYDEECEVMEAVPMSGEMTVEARLQPIRVPESVVCLSIQIIRPGAYGHIQAGFHSYIGYP